MTALELVKNSHVTAKARGVALTIRFAVNAKGDAVAYKLPDTPHWWPGAEGKDDGDLWRAPIVATINGQPCRMTANGPITAAEEQWQEVAP